MMDLTAQLFDRLDQDWSVGKPPDLSLWLKDLPPMEPRVRQELCAADLEWRWRFGNKAAAHDYAPLLADQWSDIECRRNLLEAEWCARSVWGDSPDVEKFAEQLSEISGWSTRLARQLHTLVPWQVQLVGLSLKAPIEVCVAHDFQIGRQGAGEPKAPAWIEESARLIVANAHFRTISRAQLRVRRTRLDEAKITNLSRVSPYRFGGQSLDCGLSTRHRLPCAFTVGELEIALVCVDHRTSHRDSD